MGFGTQTIIRNFISGMIVLMERRVQIGDVIELDGITGTVTSVDLRSTTVSGADGLETIVPNSMLLEQKVTNWTLSNRSVRRSVSVGVAYGTPMRKAAELIEETARRHGNVMKDPPPFVIFESFGDSAQVLTLYFWVELAPAVAAMPRMSPAVSAARSWPWRSLRMLRCAQAIAAAAASTRPVLTPPQTRSGNG